MVAVLEPAAKLTLKAGVEGQRDGDLFLNLPGALIGYSKTDLAASGSAGLSIDHNGGRSHLTASLASLQHGKAHFTLPGLKPTRIVRGITITPSQGDRRGHAIILRLVDLPPPDHGDGSGILFFMRVDSDVGFLYGAS